MPFNFDKEYYITRSFQIILVEDPLLDWPMMGAFVVPNKPIQVEIIFYQKIIRIHFNHKEKYQEAEHPSLFHGNT